MSRITIDTGTAGNPATGDSLRAAFGKVNTNFEEIYNELGASGILSDLSFKDNIISTDDTNQNLILSPNGTGQVIIGGFGFSGNILSTTDSNANIELDPAGTGNLILKSCDLLPATDNSQYLGSASKRWHTLYVGPGSINIDGVILSASGGKLNMGADIEVNAISSADSSAIQINDAVNISGATHLHGALTVTGDLITLGRETAADAGSSGMSGTRILGSLELTNPNGSSTMAMGMSFAGASGGEGQMIFEGNNASGYALVPSNNNQYTLGRPEVAGPGSAAYWKNLYVYNVNFPDSTEQTTAARITVVGDDSTGTTFNAGETIKIAGGTGITTAMSGDILTITNTGGGGGAITFVGDDSTGTAVNTGETIKIAGTQNITTAVSGDTLTITGPNLSAYIESSFTIVTGDGSTTFSAVANQRYGVNTSAGSITVNLPSSPATGDAIFFADAGGAFSTNNLTIGRNGNTIMGLSENMTISTNNASTGLFYTGSTWRIY